MKITTTKSVGGTLTATVQRYGQDLLITTKGKSMDQEKKENMFTQETVWEL